MAVTASGLEKFVTPKNKDRLFGLVTGAPKLI